MAIELIGRIGEDGQLEIELPEGLPPGTVVHVSIEPTDPNQAWFWTPEWQARERRVDHEAATGQYKDFANMDDFLDDLFDDDED